MFLESFLVLRFLPKGLCWDDLLLMFFSRLRCLPGLALQRQVPQRCRAGRAMRRLDWDDRVFGVLVCWRFLCLASVKDL